MERISKFEKVSESRFVEDWLDTFGGEEAQAKQVYESIPKDYTIIYLADHGGHDRTHGTEMDEDMTIPLFFMGPRFEKGKVLPEGSIKDVAPTVAALLECEPAEEWEGTSRV